MAIYEAIESSPVTTLTSAYTVGDDTLTVTHLEYVPTAPNIIVLGVNDKTTNVGVYTYSGKSDDSGNGQLTGIVYVSGNDINRDSGTKCARTFTAFDWNSIEFGTTSETFCEGNDARLSDARTPTTHAHGNVTNDGKIGTTEDLVVVTGTSGALTAKTAGTSDQFLRGDGVWASPPSGAVNIDGGSASTNYTTEQNIDCGGA